MTVEEDARAAIAALRARLPDMTGALVATIDGLLVAHDTHGVEPETLAAMSAAHLGLARQFAGISAQGEFSEAVIRSTGGCVAVFAAGASGLLTVLAGSGVNVGRLYHEARPVALRIGVALTPTDAATATHRVRTTGR